MFSAVFRIYKRIKALKPPTRRENAPQDAETVRLLFIFPGALCTLIGRSDASAKSKSSIMFSKNHGISFTALITDVIY